MREIAPGVHWIRMPLPGALDHINLWAIEDGEGWAVVDTGLRSEKTAEAWCRLFAGAMDGRPVTRVFVTHLHPDHAGMAGWLARRFDCRLWMTRLEYLSCRSLVADTGREAPRDAIAFLQRAGWNDEAVERYRARFGNFGSMFHAMPDSYRRLRDGECFAIGSHAWQVVVGSGHSPEHACLWCPELKLLISGDQVLPRITSNVSVHPAEPDENPLGDWLASIASLRAQLPDELLVLPAHDEPFIGLHERLDALAANKLRKLDQLRRTLREPRRVVDLFAALFGSVTTDGDGWKLGLATGEALSHLNYLIQLGEVSRDVDDDSVAWYRMSTPTSHSHRWNHQPSRPA